MPKTARRKIAAIAVTLLAITTVTVAVPSSAAEAAPIFYNGAGSAPRISVIGDSTIAALRWTNTFGPLRRFNYTYDAESCRRTVLPSCRGREGYTPDNTLSAMRRLSGQLGSVLVIMGGYDDPSYQFDRAVNAVMAEAARQGIPTVMWLTLRTNVSYIGPGAVSYSGTFRSINRTLLQKAIQYGARLQIADWAAYSASHPEWFYADGIHFRSAGATAVASYIASQAARILAGQIITPPEGLGRPSSPRSLTAWVYPDRVTLGWAAPASNGGRPITAYLVQRSTDGGRTWLNVSGVPFPTQRYTVTGLTVGTTYRFRVSARNDRGWSSYAIVTATPQLMRPWPPRSLTGWVYPDRVNLTWVPPASDGGLPIWFYVVQRSTDGGRTFHTFSRAPATSRSFTATGLATGRTYQFRVFARNSLGDSRVSNIVTATPQLMRPWPPRSLTATAGSGRVTLRWVPPASDGGLPIWFYVVQRSTDGGRTFHTFSKAPATSRSFTATGLTNGTTYQFRVFARNSLGDSRVSNIVRVTPRVAASVAVLAAEPATTTAVPTTTTTSTTTTAVPTTTTTSTTSSTTQIAQPVAPEPPAETDVFTIGDFVWLDANGNGLQDPDEAGVEGVDVVLLDASGVELSRDTTDEFGLYEFADVALGTYVLELELPEGHGITVADQGSDDELDSDLVIVDEQRGTALTDVLALSVERPDGFDFGLVASDTPTTEVPATTSASTTAVPTTTPPIEEPTSEPPPTEPPPTEPPPTEPPPTEPPPTEPAATQTTTSAAPTTSASPTTVLAPTTVGG